MALPSCHNLKIGEWTWFTNHNTMGSTIWQVYRQMEASMQNATEKMVSLTYMPVSKRYLPWRGSNHGINVKFPKKRQKSPEKQPIPDNPSSQVKRFMRWKKWSFKNIWHFHSYKMTFWITICTICVERKNCGEKRANLPPKELDHSNWTKIIR